MFEWFQKDIGIYTDLNGHGSFACTVKRKNGQATCEMVGKHLTLVDNNLLVLIKYLLTHRSYFHRGSNCPPV